MHAPGLPRASVLLELDLTEPPVQSEPEDPLSRLRARSRRRLAPTLRALHQAGTDPRVGGLIARVGGPLPWALMEEIRLGVAAFRASGKPALAWAETFGEGPGEMAAYVLATAFEEVWLQPGGTLGLLGVAVEATFLRGALDRVGLEPQIEQRHEYKNAADRLMRTGFTPAHRESLDRLAESVFEDAVTAIAQGRRLDAPRVRDLVETGPRTAAEAHAAGLVDTLGYRDQAFDAIRARVGTDAHPLFADLWHPRRRPRIPARGRGHVALVDVVGTIVSGRTRPTPTGRLAGSDSVGAALRAAADDDGARAVVLRIDSPGGSAVASETIWREVSRVREAGKPVVVSMGRAAASGGYYIACPADAVVALPATLTGSIGVFGGKVVVSDLLERLGVATGAVEHGARSRMFSPRRPFTAEELERLAALLDAVYEDFVAKVATGRGMTAAQVEAVARGRVWTGRDALGVGLVDHLGGLRDAVRIARERTGLPDEAPLRPALHVPPLARLRPPRSSEDPRATASVRLPALADLTAALGLPLGEALLMPAVTVR